MEQPSDDPPMLNHVKGRRGPSSSSCAECKRLKIRCTGTTKGFPCASCERRGVAGICPNGVMPERQRRNKEGGDSDILRRRNQLLAARVKELEEALAKATGATPGSTITSDSRKMDEEEEEATHNKDDEGLVESFGTLTIEETGRTIWHGPYTPTFNLLPSDEYHNTPSAPEYLVDETLPPELMLLAAGFPLTRPGGLQGAKDAIRRLMPTYDEAAVLTDHFFGCGTWMGSPYKKEDFFRDILIPAYTKTSWANVPSDLLALVCGVLAVGCVFDLSRELYDPLGFRLSKLCAALLALAKPIDHPTLTSLEALQLHLFFYQLADTPISLSRFWSLSALAFRMAQALGLHRDSSACGLDPALEQKRRAIFWQLNFMDGVVSASYGRPRYFNSRQYDCPFPEESSLPGIAKVSIYRFEFLRDGLLPVLEEGFAVTPPPTYATVMKLDQKIRNLPMLDPEQLGINLMQLTAAECMQFFCIGGLRELVLLYLHRRYLFIAASDEKCEDMTKHKFGYSVIAGYTAAVGMIRQLRGLFYKDPVFATRLFFLWLHGFSAFIVMATIVIKRPASEFAESAVAEMESLLSIFLQAQSSRRVKRCLPSMLTLKEKARTILALHRTGQKIKTPPDAQLERLLGGVSVVLKSAASRMCDISSETADAPPTQPRAFSSFSTVQPQPQQQQQQQQASELDLQALLGFPENALNFDVNNIQSASQPESFDWNIPLETPSNVPFDRGAESDDLLGNLFQGQSAFFGMDENTNWETLVSNFS